MFFFAVNTVSVCHISQFHCSCRLSTSLFVSKGIPLWCMACRLLYTMEFGWYIVILIPVQIVPYLHQITRTTTQIAATTVSTTVDTAIPATRTRVLDDPEVGSVDDPVSSVRCHEGRQNKLYLVCEPDCEPLSLQNVTCGTHGCTCTVNTIIIINIHNQ